MKKTTIITLLVLSTNLLISQQWNQFGDTIKRFNSVYNFSNNDPDLPMCFDMSGDGLTIAVGAYNIMPNPAKGRCFLFYYNGTTWIKETQVILGNNIEFGVAVALDYSGSLLAIYDEESYLDYGSVSIYKKTSGVWSKQGADIVGTHDISSKNASLSFSDDGSTLAVGYRKHDSAFGAGGIVNIYKFDGTNWVQKGNTILGSMVNDNSGYSLDLDFDGNTIVIGAPGRTSATGGIAARGRVKVYSYSSSSNIWTLKGSVINSLLAWNHFGMSVAINDSGTIVAGGSPSYDDAGKISSGKVSVFEFSSSNWSQKGSDIKGAMPRRGFGFSISLSGDGKVIAIAQDGSSNRDSTFVYRYSLGNWIKKGTQLKNEANLVSLSSDGNRLATCLGSEDLITFDFSSPASLYEAHHENQVTLFPNPCRDNVTIKFNGGYKSGSLSIYNAVGQKVECEIILSENLIEIDTHNLLSGIYFVKVKTGDVNISKKLIVQ